HRLDDQLAGGKCLQRVHRLQAHGCCVCLLGAETAARGFLAQARAQLLRATVERLWDGIVQERPRARAARELGDAGPHRAGTQHADDARWAAHAGTSAPMPVISRPMISFWICEVPSYRVVTRASRNHRPRECGSTYPAPPSPWIARLANSSDASVAWS